MKSAICRRMVFAVLGAFLALSSAGAAFAQEDDEERDHKPPRRDEGGEERRFQPPGGEGSAAIVVDEEFVYVLMGGTLFKIDKESFKIVSRLELRKEVRPNRDESFRPRPPEGEEDEEDRPRPPRDEDREDDREPREDR